MYSIAEIENIIKGKIIHDNLKIIDTFSIDSNNIKSNTLFIPIIGQKHNGNKFIPDAIKNGVAGCLIQKDYDEKENLIIECIENDISIIEVDDTQNALTELARYNRLKNSTTIVIGITGSNGKTSTKDLIYDILKNDFKVLKSEGNLNNHIGLPLTLLNLNKHDICILEMGMNHLGEIEHLSKIAKPNIAIITNIGTAHIGLLGSKAKILEAKLEIIKGLQKSGVLLLNNEDKLLKNVKLNKYINVLTYGLDDIYNLEYKKDKIIFYADDKKIKIKQVGEYDLINAILAYKISSIFGIKVNKFKKYLKKHKKPKMRMEHIKYKKNIIINDCYNANYDSMRDGIKYITKKFKNHHILLYLGDMLELGEWSKQYHSLIGKLINKSNIDILYVTGNDVRYILNELDSNQKTIKKEFKINSDNDIKIISKIILNDLHKYKKSVLYFKSSRRLGLDKIVSSILSSRNKKKNTS